MRMSFAWDRPKDKYSIRAVDVVLRRRPFINDEIQRGKVVCEASDGVRIVEKAGKQFLTRDKKHVISPKFDAVRPSGDGLFTAH